MKTLISLTLFLMTLTAWSKGGHLRTVDYVDVQRYVGKWYAISALPQFFTRKCIAQTAEYEIINPQTISVLNTCLKVKGQTKIFGQAVVKNAETNAELIVTFNNFFTRLFRVKGDYNIISLDGEYRYVTVASEDRKSLWIMSRTPSMPLEVYNEYVKEARSQKFPTDKLIISRFK